MDETVSRTISEATARRMVHAFKVLTSVRKQALIFGQMSDSNTSSSSSSSSAGGDRTDSLQQKISPGVRHELDELFSHYDADRSGNVDYDEFIMILKQVGGGSATYNDDELRQVR